MTIIFVNDPRITAQEIFSQKFEYNSRCRFILVGFDGLQKLKYKRIALVTWWWPVVLQRSISYSLSEALQGGINLLSPSPSTASLQSSSWEPSCNLCNYQRDSNGFVLFSASNDFNNNGSVKKSSFYKQHGRTSSSSKFAKGFSLRKKTSVKFGEVNFKVRLFHNLFLILF